eukprot:4034591-Prymnesium_polylepis.1
MGVAPTLDGPLVNEPGHPLSSVRIDVEVSAGSAPLQASCSFSAVALDYTGLPYVRDAAGAPDLQASTAKEGPTLTASLGAAASHTFSFAVARGDYRRLSPTALDAPMAAVDPEEALYGLKLSAFCYASDGTTFVSAREKMLCEPLIATSTRSRIACAARRGTFDAPPSDGGVLAHLTTSACRAAGITSSTVNDGHCNAANNVAGCYDGGDCCAYSCWAKNGKFIQLAAGGGWEFAHSCYAVNDSATCLDPLLLSYEPPANFSTTAAGGTPGVETTGTCAPPDRNLRAPRPEPARPPAGPPPASDATLRRPKPGPPLRLLCSLAVVYSLTAACRRPLLVNLAGIFDSDAVEDEA